LLPDVPLQLMNMKVINIKRYPVFFILVVCLRLTAAKLRILFELNRFSITFFIILLKLFLGFCINKNTTKL